MINDAMQSGCFIGTAGMRFIHHMKRFTLKRRGTNLEKTVSFCHCLPKKRGKQLCKFPNWYLRLYIKTTKKDVHSFLAKKLL